jgi:hypothetical protein
MMRACLAGPMRPLLSTCACAVWLAGACVAPPPPPAAPRAEPVAAPRPPAIRRAPCFLVALAYGSAQTIERDQTIRAGDGDVIHAGRGDVILTGTPRLAVLEVDLFTGALRTRAEIPIGDREVSLSAAAIRGQEIALLVHVEDVFATARIDLASRHLDVSAPMSFEDMAAGNALASDGEAYYRYCRRGELCRGKDWELRGNPIGLPSSVRFDDIAVAASELYGLEDTTVHVVELASKQETRRFTIGRERRESGVGISGDELVTADRQTLTRYDRATGEKRGSVPLALPRTVAEVRLTCGR